MPSWGLGITRCARLMQSSLPAWIDQAISSLYRSCQPVVPVPRRAGLADDAILPCGGGLGLVRAWALVLSWPAPMVGRVGGVCLVYIHLHLKIVA